MFAEDRKKQQQHTNTLQVRAVVSNHLCSVATFATIVATKVFLSPLLSEFERYTVYLSLELQFWTTVCRHIKISCRHMWRMETRLDNTGLEVRELTWLTLNLFEVATYSSISFRLYSIYLITHTKIVESGRKTCPIYVYCKNAKQFKVF